MSNGNQQSVSLSEGTLSPDLRVNYELGLVLGVNEFRQEQQYFLYKDYLHNRAFEGYGIISGLHVTAEWQKGEEVLITVSPGVAIDQFGRLLVVREEQCARLAAWLKKQEQQKAGTIAAHRGDDKKLRLYIVASYDEYPDALVPVAGQACNAGDKQYQPSRLRDFYAIGFAWDKPAMPAWESVRAFARLMGQVRVEAGADEDDDETEALLEQVRKLDTPQNIDWYVASDSDDDKDERDEDDEKHKKRERHWIIPARSARASFDRVFTVWVTEVRPKLQPELVDPDMSNADAARILLASIEVEPDDDFPDSDPRIDEDGFTPPDNSGRPYLLHTQAMQELLLPGHVTRVEEGRGSGEPAKEFATVQVCNSSTLYAWVHHPAALDIEQHDGDWDDALAVRSDDEPLAISNVRKLAANMFEIRVKAAGGGAGGGGGSAMQPGARVELLFKIDGIGLHQEGEEDENGEDGEDDEGGEEEGLDELEDTVEREVKEVGHVVRDVSKGTADVAEEIAGAVEQGAGELVEGVGKGVRAIGRALEKEIGVGEDIAKAGAHIQKAGEHVEQEGQELIASAQADEKALDESEGFEDNREHEGKHDDGDGDDDDEQSLGDDVKKPGFNYVGYDRQKETISVYTIANYLPVRELVTFFTFDSQADMTNTNLPHAALRQAASAERFLALWFHTDNPVRLPRQVRILRLFVGDKPQVLWFKTTPAGGAFSSFWALEPLAESGVAPLVPGELLRIVFNTNNIRVGQEGKGNSVTLTRFMQEEHFTCSGYDGDRTIALHHQVSLLSQVSETRVVTDKLAAEGAREPVGVVPARPFVTTTVTRLNELARGRAEVTLEMWFHLSLNLAEDREYFAEELIFEMLLEEDGQTRAATISTQPATRVRSNVYTAQVILPTPRAEQQFYYLRLRFPLDRNRVEVRDSETSYPNLGEYIRSTGIRFEGHNGTDAIVTYMRTPVARRTTETGR